MKKKINVSITCLECGKRLDDSRINWNYKNAVQYRFSCRNCHYHIDIVISGKVKKR